MYSYDTVVAALEGLRSRGYALNFNLAFDQLVCSENGACLNPNEFEIVEVHRFEGNSDPNDSDVVYAIESKREPVIKGVFTSAYGTYASGISSAMLQKLSIHK